MKSVLSVIRDVAEEYDEVAPVDVVLERADDVGIREEKAEHEIENLKQKGKFYETRTDHLRSS
ncbi:hypothetical protein [Haloarcula marina]|uniref:hypothetical protein n=1 Tax=Haloarcula marina TaxID=2961574 RepID=UPI003D69FC51